MWFQPPNHQHQSTKQLTHLTIQNSLYNILIKHNVLVRHYDTGLLAKRFKTKSIKIINVEESSKFITQKATRMNWEKAVNSLTKHGMQTHAFVLEIMDECFKSCQLLLHAAQTPCHLQLLRLQSWHLATHSASTSRYLHLHYKHSSFITGVLSTASMRSKDTSPTTMFTHIRCLPEGTPAHQAFHASAESHADVVPHSG